MRIVIDMQGAQSESRFRGIGRYTLSFVSGIVRNRGDHEVILALNGMLAESIEPIRNAFEGLLPPGNIRVWQAPGPVREIDPKNEARREAAELIREAFLESLEPDVIHITSLFEGYVDDAVTSIGRFGGETPVSVSLFDLIPLLNPKQYLAPQPRYANSYLRKVEHLKKASLFLAISEFTRQEGLSCLAMDEGRAVNVSTAIEPKFKRHEIDGMVAKALLARFGVNKPYILYTGGADERKNLPRLIEAFAQLPASLRARYQLMLAGKMPEDCIAEFKRQAESAGLSAGDLKFTGYVADDELVQLYGLCELFVFPSWHEGFGLPALEAMACGAPVIGSNVSSIPEVIGLDKALFDPLVVADITAKMRQVLDDADLKAALQAHGLKQATLFSWDESARRAIAAFEKIHLLSNNAKKRTAEQIFGDLASELAESLPADVSQNELAALAIALDDFERQIAADTLPAGDLPGSGNEQGELSTDLATIAPSALALDMYVLGQGVKTGVYRVCDELFPRLLNSKGLSSNYLVRNGFESGTLDYIREKGLPEDLLVYPVDCEPPPSVDILLSPFGVAPGAWRAAENMVHAHVIYDLIAIHHPEYFTPEGANEVAEIMASLDRDSVIFAISEYTKQDLLAYRTDLTPSQVTVIPLAAAEKFRFCEDVSQRVNMRTRYGIPAGVPYILSLATLEVRKNMEQVVRSFVRYLDQNPQCDLHLVLSGMSGWKLERLESALATAEKWRDRIILTGFVDDADLSALYSDALCFLYLSRYEGFGLPPLEAMACGTPVITSNNSSLPEVVGTAGVTLDPDDIEAVARAIADMVGSPGFRDRYSQLALERARLFSWDRCAEIVEQKLVEAVAAKRLKKAKQHELEFFDEYEELGKASLFGYLDGFVGPEFPRQDWVPPKLPDGTIWPLWADSLPEAVGTRKAEGGLRTQGVLKHGSAEKPLISYVTVVRNNEKTLERTIQSVQQQTYDNVEHIILDGASTDGTLDIIRKYAGKIDYFASEPDKGLYDAINKAIPLSRGDMICVLNSDDWLHPDSAAIAAKHMGDGKFNGLLLTSANVVKDGAIVHYWKPAFVHPGSYFICADVCHNGIYATRQAYERSGPYDSTYKVAADFKWIMQCLDSGSVFKYTTEPGVYYSLGGTSSNIAQHAADCIRVVSERFELLEKHELNGLYHCFHAFSSLRGLGDVDVPPSYTNFIKRLLSKYVDNKGFQLALAWASAARMRHEGDIANGPVAHIAAPVVEASGFKRGVKSVLSKYPTTYKHAARLYKTLTVQS